ncbi:FAD-binding oxidoreductase [Dongia sp.]|uniref:FAD-binding oxidoreductase n=1 Tax=Dongia sp. TaxID=1977262 RepID=UPI0035B292DE
MKTADLIEKLKSAVGEAAVLVEPRDIEPYTRDWRRMFEGRPACVVRPGNTSEVSAILRACHDSGATIVPHGGNTGMAGGATPDATGTQVVLSLQRMAEIRSLDPVGLTIEVEAGAVLQTVKEAVAETGRILPISLASEGSATIGGIISTNAGGVNVVRYGMARGLTLGLEVVLADGTVINGLRHLRKDNAGYDLKQLFIGSEGTLGVVTAAVLRLMPNARHRVTALLGVPDVSAAIKLFDLAMTEIGEAISAFELISTSAMSLMTKHSGLVPPIAPAGWTILLEATSSLAGLRPAAEALLEQGFDRGLVSDGVIAESDSQAAGLWAMRERLSEAEGCEGPSVKHDVSVPLPAMPAFLRETEDLLATIAPSARLNVFGHLGDGNLHTNVLLGPGSNPKEINAAVHDLVAKFNGSISAEHGVGQYRVDELQRLKPVEELQLMVKIKKCLDPDRLLNPSKVVA